MSGSASSGKPPAEHARHAQRPLGLAAQFGRARLRVETRIGGGGKGRRLMQHAGLPLSQRNHAARRQSAHGEPGRAVDHLNRGTDLTARLMPFRLVRERFTFEVENGQEADATIAAGAGLDQQGPLAMATPQLFGAGFFRRRTEIAQPVEDAVGQRLLVIEKVQNLVLNRIFANEIDDRNRTGLVLPPGPCDALLKLRRVPR